MNVPNTNGSIGTANTAANTFVEPYGTTGDKRSKPTSTNARSFDDRAIASHTAAPFGFCSTTRITPGPASR